MNTKEQVKAILVELKKGMEKNLESGELVTGGLLDSFDIIALITELEESFDIEIDLEDVVAENFESVDAIAALVEKCKG